MPIVPSWPGRYFEDLQPGDVYEHRLGRTITQADNVWFTLLTLNNNPIHFDAVYAAATEFKRPLVDSTFTLALVTGLSVDDLSRHAVNLGWDEVRLPNPVFEGDTIRARSEVLACRESRSHPDMGIVTFRTTGYNQDGKTVIEFKRTIMVYRRGMGPEGRVEEPGQVWRLAGGRALLARRRATGAKLRRWIGQGPSSESARAWARVP